MKLWVLKSSLCEVEIYVTPEQTYTEKILEALKFNTEQSALNYMVESGMRFVIEFKPELVEIEFKE